VDNERKKEAPEGVTSLAKPSNFETVPIGHAGIPGVVEKREPVSIPPQRDVPVAFVRRTTRAGWTDRSE
jgi:hypothetical protein